MLDSWVKELRDEGPPDVILMIAANKHDLPGSASGVDEAYAFANEHKATLNFTSAKTGHGVDLLFENLASKVMEKRKL